MSNNTQETHEQHYVLSWTEAHGPLFGITFANSRGGGGWGWGGLLLEIKPTGLKCFRGFTVWLCFVYPCKLLKVKHWNLLWRTDCKSFRLCKQRSGNFQIMCLKLSCFQNNGLHIKCDMTKNKKNGAESLTPCLAAQVIRNGAKS